MGDPMDKKFMEFEDSYKGYVYLPETDIEPEENIKIFHNVQTPGGKTIHLDMSPYHHPTFEEFALWVDLGCPTRQDFVHGCNFDHDDLIQLLRKGIVSEQ
jgi:hypothetical protein